MTKLIDNDARLRALTDLHATLLVEAAAGTGKTALMAARLTMLLAGGAEPRSIAAITFTELAASALAARVHRYVDELLSEHVPEPLRTALPTGLSNVPTTTSRCCFVRHDDAGLRGLRDLAKACRQAREPVPSLSTWRAAAPEPGSARFDFARPP